MKTTLDFIRELILDHHLTKEEQKSGLILEVPEKTFEKIVSEIKKEITEAGLIPLSSINKEDLELRIKSPIIRELVLSEGFLDLIHSNRFALYPKVNKVEYR